MNIKGLSLKDPKSFLDTVSTGSVQGFRLRARDVSLVVGRKLAELKPRT